MAVDAVTTISGLLAERPDATSVSVDTKFIVEDTGVEYFCSAGMTAWVQTASGGGASTAADLAVTPAGNIASTNAQAALEELDDEKQSVDAKGSPDGYPELNGDGVVPGAQLGSGTADATTFLRGDNTWQTIAGGGTDDQVASEVPFTPAGNIAATDVQAALEELDTEKSGTAHTHSPAAADVAYTPAGNVAATDVQAAITELDTDKSATTHNHDGTYSAAAHNHDADYEASGATATHNAQTTSVHGITDTAALVTTDNTGLISPVINYGTDNTTARPNRDAVIWIGTDRTIEPDNIDAADGLILPGLDEQFVWKSADTTRSNTSTLADDPHLSITLAASATYHIRVILGLHGTTTGDAQIGWTVPSGATGHAFHNVHFGASSTSGSPSRDIRALTGSQRINTVGTGLGSAVTSEVDVMVTTTGTGTFAVTWAQFSAEVSDLVAVQNSFLWARQVG